MRSGALFLLLISTRAWAVGETIVGIDVSGNTKTNTATVRDIAGVDEGDKVVDGLVERVTVDLQSCGLFKDVRVAIEPEVGSLSRVRMKIAARDKHSWIIAPTFYNQPGNVGGGLGFGENNLFGRNKKMLLYAQIATADSFFLGGYMDPSIGGTRFYWRVDTILRRSKITEYDSPDEFLGQPEPLRNATLDYLNGGLLFGMNLWKGFSIDGRLRGARVSYHDAAYVDGAELDPSLPVVAELPDDDGWDVSTEWKLTRDYRSNWNGVTRGSVLQLQFDRSLTALGSHWDYWGLGLRAQVYKKLLSTHNLALKTSIASGHHLPFQQEYTAGGVNLRGYKDKQFRGDFKAAGTLEYSFQLFWIGPLAFRTLGFWDTAYITFLQDEGNETRDYLPGQTEEKASRWRNGVGGGLRVYVKSIVLPLLGVDVGYGVEAHDYHIYFAVGLTEL